MALTAKHVQTISSLKTGGGWPVSLREVAAAAQPARCWVQRTSKAIVDVYHTRSG